MVHMVRTYLRHFVRNERAATLAEYGLIVALVALAALTVLSDLGGNIVTKLKSVSSKIKAAQPK